MVTEQLKEGCVTHGYGEAAISSAEVDVWEFIAENGPVRPGDLEDEFYGEPHWTDRFINPLSGWRTTPQYPALARMVDRGVVAFERDDEGTVWYWLA